jgi:Leu/Phe-tRNA-protein transferase
LYLFFNTITKKEGFHLHTDHPYPSQDEESAPLSHLIDTIQLGIHHLPYKVVIDRKVLEKYIYSDMHKNYYWSEDYSADYYIAQAKAGFIAVTDYIEDKELLLPEIQFAYTLLDFENLHISRKVQKLLKQKRLKLEKITNLDEIVQAIESAHRNNWLTSKYLSTLKATEGVDANFEILAFGIREAGVLVAGEIGYRIGCTYTSLSGFTKREKRYNHYGTLQLVLLAHYLKAEKFTFWNLGQPYMAYKFALGAKVYERHAFLKRWFKATACLTPGRSALS